jgi:hypothetical protein
LLLPIDPAGDHEKEQLELCVHGQQKTVKTPGSQASTSLRPNYLALQQLWKTNNGYVQIWHIGKRLIDYKTMKQLGQKAVKTQTTAIETLKEYLNCQKAVLTVASRA